MKLLLDTHIVLWLHVEPQRVPDVYLRLIAGANTRYVSAISATEIILKRRKLGDQFPFTTENLREAMDNLRCEELPVRIHHQAPIDQFPPIHKDPADLILMAQAITEGLILVTADRRIRQYKLPGLLFA